MGLFGGIKVFKNNIFKRVFLTFKEDESNGLMNNRCWEILPQFSLHIFDISNLYCQKCIKKIDVRLPNNDCS